MFYRTGPKGPYHKTTGVINSIMWKVSVFVKANKIEGTISKTLAFNTKIDNGREKFYDTGPRTFYLAFCKYC